MNPATPRSSPLNVSIIDGRYVCPVSECSNSYTTLKALRNHCDRSHDGQRITHRRRMLLEERRARQRRYTAAYRARNAPRTRSQRPRPQRLPFDTDDADERGTFGCSDPILEHKQSRIPNAGNGLFALQDLRKGDIVTWYAGEYSDTAAADRSYTIGIDGGRYINGIRVPKKRHGLGSFINREDRSMSRVRANCAFVVCERTAHYMYVEIMKKVKAGDELYTTYSRGYRIPRS